MTTKGKFYKGGTKPTGLKSAQLAQKVRYHRLQRGLSQQELADGICSMQLISSIERGTSNPRVKTLEKIADRLNVPLGEIYQPDEDEFPNKVKLQLVEAYMKRGEYEVAQETLDELGNRADLVEIEKQHASLLQGELLNKIGRAADARDVLLSLIDSLEIKQNTDDEFKCKTYNQLGTSYFFLRNFTKAYSAYMRGHQLALRLPVFEMTAATVTFNLGIICNELELRHDSKQYLDMAREYYESVADIRKMADAYFNSAIATNEESYLVKAKNLYESLECFGMLQIVRQHEAFYVEAKKDYLSAVNSLLKVANEFDVLNERERSLFTLCRAVVVCMDNSDRLKTNECLALANIKRSEIVGDAGQYIPYFYYVRAKYNLYNDLFDECLQDAQKASELYDIMGMLAYSADALDLIVKVHTDRGDYKKALEVSQKVNEMLRKKGGANL